MVLLRTEAIFGPNRWHAACNSIRVQVLWTAPGTDHEKTGIPNFHVVKAAMSLLLLAIGSGGLLGCAKIPATHAAVDSIDVKGNRALSERELKKHLATRETSKFLGLVQGVIFDYRLYNHYVLQADIQRIERIYRARGYYHARARSTRVIFKSDDHVRILVEVEEGEPTLVESIEIQGVDGLPPQEQSILRRAMSEHLREGRVFDQDAFKAGEGQLLLELRSLGYAYARVERSAKVDLARHSAQVTFSAIHHDKAVYGPITIEGLGEGIPEKMVRRALMIEPGDRYSQRELESAQQAALALGVFSSVRIVPQLSEDGPTEEVPLVIECEMTPLHTFELGAGVQLDVIRAATYGMIGWRAQNFLGGLREFRARVKPGVVFYPTRLQSLVPPTDILPFVSAQTTLRQPQVFEARTDGVVRGDFDMYPLLLSPHVDEDAPVLGYREVEGAVALERVFGSHIFASPKYSLQWAVPFAYQGMLDPDLGPLLISAGDISARFDSRDDPVFPTRGIAVNLDLQYAGGPFGADVDDVRTKPEVRFYVPLGRQMTLATRAGIGLLFPRNWGDTLGTNDGQPPAGTPRAQWVRDTQISLFRSFFAGGPNSNRGYASRGIGPHGVIPFFVPDLQGPQVAAQCEEDPEADPANCLLPLGGRTLWEASVELRFPIMGPLYGATFCDTADVAPQTLRFRFDRPHLSCGAGARYSTPVGPLRFDVGYRIPGAQTIRSDAGEGIPPTLFGLPIAVAISIGEAF